MPAALAPSQLPAATDLRRAVAEHRLSTNPHHFRNEPALHRPFLVLDPATPSTPCPVLVDRTSPLPPPATVPVTYGIHGHSTPSRMVAFTVPPTAPPAFLAVASVSEAALRLPIRAASLLRTTSAVWPDGMSRAVLQSGWRAFVTDAPVSVSHLPPHQSRAFSEALDSFKALLMDDVHRPSNRIRLDPGRVVVIDNHSFPWVLYGDGAREVRTISLPELNTPELDTVLLAASRAKLWSGSGKDCPKPPPEEHLFDLNEWPVNTKKQLEPLLCDYFDKHVAGHGDVVFGDTGGTTRQTQSFKSMGEVAPIKRSTIACKLRNQFVQRARLADLCVDIGIQNPETMEMSTLGMRSAEVQTDVLNMAGGTMVMMEAKWTDDQIIEAVQTLKPNVFSGVGTGVLQLALTCIRRKVRLDSIKQLKFGGEMLIPKQYDVFAKAFAPDVQVFEIYGSAETGTYALRSPDSDQFRLASDTMIVEVMDDDGNEVAFGTEGRVVLTNLTRTEIPMVRYDTGDRAVKKGPRKDEFALSGRMRGLVQQKFGEVWVDLLDVNGKIGGPLCDELDGLCDFQLLIEDGARKVTLAVYAGETDVEKLRPTEEVMCRAMRKVFPEESLVEEIGVTWLTSYSQLYRVPATTKLLRFVNL